METFKDCLGRNWVLNLTYNLADKIKADHGVDLLDLEDIGKTFVKFQSLDMRLFFEVLWTMIEKQADAAGITEESYGEGMDGEATARAMEAFEKAIVNFSQSPEQRKVKENLFRASHEYLTETVNEKLSVSELRGKMSESAVSNSQGLQDLTTGQAHSGL